jgi:hypothetical protein
MQTEFQHESSGAFDTESQLESWIAEFFEALKRMSFSKKLELTQEIRSHFLEKAENNPSKSMSEILQEAGSPKQFAQTYFEESPEKFNLDSKETRLSKHTQFWPMKDGEGLQFHMTSGKLVLEPYESTNRNEGALFLWYQQDDDQYEVPRRTWSFQNGKLACDQTVQGKVTLRFPMATPVDIALDLGKCCVEDIRISGTVQVGSGKIQAEAGQHSESLRSVSAVVRCGKGPNKVGLFDSIANLGTPRLSLIVESGKIEM